jgi:hypothetical protein
MNHATTPHVIGIRTMARPLGLILACAVIVGDLALDLHTQRFHPPDADL